MGIMDFLKCLLKNKTSHQNEDLTSHECELVLSKKCEGVLICPDCTGNLLTGIECGGLLNCLCENCGSEFGISILHGEVMGRRLSDAGPRDPGERIDLYQ